MAASKRFSAVTSFKTASRNTILIIASVLVQSMVFRDAAKRQHETSFKAASFVCYKCRVAEMRSL